MKNWVKTQPLQNVSSRKWWSKLFSKSKALSFFLLTGWKNTVYVCVLNPRSYDVSIFLDTEYLNTFWKTNPWSKLKYSYTIVGGFNPFEKYARQIGSFPQVGLKI